MSHHQPPVEQETRLRALAIGLVQGHITILHLDTTAHFDLVENLPPNWPHTEIIGRTVADALPALVARRFDEAIAAAHQAGMRQVVDFALGESAARRLFEAQITPDRSAQTVHGTTIVLTDVTEQRNRELALHTLMREVSHRSKNLLAIVQSVAMQTARHSTTIENYLSRFRGRLHALSSTQDLVTESNWRGTTFKSLVSAQIGRIGQPATSRILIEGDDPLLGPNASLHVGLAVHELATNAVLHGALGDSDGTVTVAARVNSALNGGADLNIEWREGPVAMPDTPAPHFGTLVLERVVPLSVGGSAEYRTEAGTLVYTLLIPAGQYET